MIATKAVWAGLLGSFMFGGCLMVPGPRGMGVMVVPPLPRIVVLGAEPYYVHGGYHYYYRNDGWAYSHSRSGPWVDLPRDHYPKEVRFGEGGPGRSGPGNPGHRGR
jgi:hypothetical protein